MSAADDRYNHSEKGLARNARYDASQKGRARHTRYDWSEKGWSRRRRALRAARCVRIAQNEQLLLVLGAELDEICKRNGMAPMAERILGVGYDRK